MLALFDGARLTPTQRRIAQCLLERGTRAAYLSSGEVAELARVSQPSVTRFAIALGYVAAKVHPDVRVLDHGGSLLTDRLEQARVAGATALLAIVLPRYPRETLDALREAHSAGLSVVVLTDSPVSPAAAHADVTLTA